MLLGPIFSIDMLTTARRAVLRLAGALCWGAALGAVQLFLRTHGSRVQHPRNGGHGRGFFSDLFGPAADCRGLSDARPGCRHRGPRARAADDRISVCDRPEQYRDRARKARFANAAGGQHGARGLAAVCPGQAVRRDRRRAAVDRFWADHEHGAVHRGPVDARVGRHAESPRRRIALLRDSARAVDRAAVGQMVARIQFGSRLAGRRHGGVRAAQPVSDAVPAALQRRGQLVGHCRRGCSANGCRGPLHGGGHWPGAQDSPPGGGCSRPRSGTLAGLAGAASPPGRQRPGHALEGVDRSAVQGAAGILRLPEPGAVDGHRAGHLRSRAGVRQSDVRLHGCRPLVSDADGALFGLDRLCWRSGHLGPDCQFDHHRTRAAMLGLVDQHAGRGARYRLVQDPGRPLLGGAGWWHW